MLSALFILLAAICKAVADTLQHHYGSSVFRFSNRRFWDPEISWKYAKFLPFTKYRLDGWHLANSGMVVFFCMAVVFHHPWLSWYYELPIAGILFNVVFNLFYNKILR